MTKTWLTIPEKNHSVTQKPWQVNNSSKISRVHCPTARVMRKGEGLNLGRKGWGWSGRMRSERQGGPHGHRGQCRGAGQSGGSSGSTPYLLTYNAAWSSCLIMFLKFNFTLKYMCNGEDCTNLSVPAAIKFVNIHRPYSTITLLSQMDQNLGAK